MKPKLTLHFAHANGFPAASYKKLFSQIDDQIDIIAIDKFAHDPRFPPNNHWQNQVDELINFIQASSNQPVIGVGHSFGAVITYIASCQKPELFSSIILLDPPLVTGFSKYLFRMAKRSPFINKITPAGKTANRKREWPIEANLYEYFSSRALFQNMDKDCIHDYIDAVIHEAPPIKRLTFDPNIECQIFRTIPDNLNNYYGKLKVPAKLVTGKYTQVCVDKLRTPFLKGNPTMEHLPLNYGGHMFPLEQPLKIADCINSTLKSWEII
ncbi:alpha/beta fold hydrolase [Glaciecola sp. 1036]|uniref:alpha/beta fold hydrolase n=1 Tax=Alteromonadaceae TaxID=72275 RepID=UPI003D062AA1